VTCARQARRDRRQEAAERRCLLRCLVEAHLPAVASLNLYGGHDAKLCSRNACRRVAENANTSAEVGIRYLLGVWVLGTLATLFWCIVLTPVIELTRHAHPNFQQGVPPPQTIDVSKLRFDSTRCCPNGQS
jgi:hypothetical protein